MRIKKNFSLRSLGDQFILVAEGNQMIDFSQMVCMNNSAAFLWDAVKDIDFCSDTISKLIVNTFCIFLNT
ncbi:MAG: PqqD family protein, partial [Bacteroidales bacterium]|nr:PqqD family protein [Bacteroidales bacterium]